MTFTFLDYYRRRTEAAANPDPTGPIQSSKTPTRTSLSTKQDWAERKAREAAEGTP